MHIPYCWTRCERENSIADQTGAIKKKKKTYNNNMGPTAVVLKCFRAPDVKEIVCDVIHYCTMVAVSELKNMHAKATSQLVC